MKGLLFGFCLFSALALALEAYQGPTTQLLVRAYCACECCKKSKADVCYKHPALNAEAKIDCSPYNCTEEFCGLLKQAECRASCFCKKCKDELHESESYRCAMRRDGQVTEGCDCDAFDADDDELNCDVRSRRPENAPTDEEMAASSGSGEYSAEEMMEKLSHYKNHARCVVTCFCHKCEDTLPSNIAKQCTEVTDPGVGCDCDETKCPTKEEYKNLETMRMEVQEAKYRAIASSNGDDQLAADTFNEKMSDVIEEGRLAPMTSEEVRLAKCELQCVCKKCREDGVDSQEAQCKRFLPKPLKNCPKCPADTKCPAASASENCPIVCMCKNCIEHPQMTVGIKNMCRNLAGNLEKSTCDCGQANNNVDCGVLNTLGGFVTSKGELNEKAKKKQKEASAQAPKKPTKGKFKPKHRHWDEL